MRVRKVFREQAMARHCPLRRTLNRQRKPHRQWPPAGFDLPPELGLHVDGSTPRRLRREHAYRLLEQLVHEAIKAPLERNVKR